MGLLHIALPAWLAVEGVSAQEIAAFLGIIMLPPITVSLPIKVMLFVLVDGWTLISSSVADSVVL